MARCFLQSADKPAHHSFFVFVFFRVQYGKTVSEEQKISNYGLTKKLLLSNIRIKVIGSSQHRLGIKVCVTYFVSTGIETPEYVIERRDFYCMFSVQ